MRRKKVNAKTKLGLVDKSLVLLTLVLVFVGLWLVFDASYAQAAMGGVAHGDQLYFLRRQAIFLAIGLVVAFVASRCRLKFFENVTLPMVIVSIVLLGLVLVCGHSAKGASRWFRIGFFNFQPAELAKLAVVLYLARLLSQNKKLVKKISSAWAEPVLVIGLVVGLILVEPDLGTVLAIGATCLAMLFAAGMPKRYLGGMLGIAALGCALAVKHSAYRMGRIGVWLNPLKNPFGDGYQIVHSLIALGSGGLKGVGICEGREKLYIPEAHTDFIFSTLGEEFGLFVCLGLLMLFLLFVFKGLDIAGHAKSVHANLLAVGITSMIGLQALINVAVVSASIPATGITLPFISYGGSSLVFTLAGVGILLAISRQGSETDN